MHCIGKKALIVCVAAAVFAMSGLAMAEPSKGTGDSTIAAKVNGRPIYLKDLTPNVDQALARSRKYGSGVLPEATRKRIQREELERQVDLELMAQAGEKSSSAPDVEKKVDERIKAQQPDASKEKHADKSAAVAKVSDESRQKLRRQVLIDEYLAKRGVQGLQVPEADQKRYYEQNKESFREGESVKVSHVLIALAKKPKPEELEKARKKIEMVRAEVKKGKDFAELARQYSACASAKDGGSLGYIAHGYMPQAFDLVAFSLKPGEVSDVVKTRHGFHLIKAFDKKPSRIQGFAEVKPLLEKFLLKKLQANKIEEIAKELRRDARIEISLN